MSMVGLRGTCGDRLDSRQKLAGQALTSHALLEEQLISKVPHVFGIVWVRNQVTTPETVPLKGDSSQNGRSKWVPC